MYAVFEDRGRQHTVKPGEVVLLDLSDAEPASSLVFDRVLMIGGESGAKVGTPILPGARVTATVLGMVKGRKLVFRKFRRRKNYRRKIGHRQRYTQVRIEKILG